MNIEKIGKVKYSSNYNIPQLDNYFNPRCHFDGKYWYLTFGFEHSENKAKLDYNLSIGIDLGIKDLAYVSCFNKPIKTDGISFYKEIGGEYNKMFELDAMEVIEVYTHTV